MNNNSSNAEATHQGAASDSTNTETAQSFEASKLQQDLHSDSRVVVTGLTYIGPQSELLPKKIGMNTFEMSHTDVLEQRVLAGKGVWKSSQSAGIKIVQIPVPSFIKDLTCSMMKQIIEMYAFMRPNLLFKAVINTTKGHLGKIILAWDPLDVWSENRDDSIFTSCNLPHVEIDAGDSNSAELPIPYDYMANYLLTTVPNPTGFQSEERPLGTLYVIVLNPLRAINTAAAPEVTVQVFVGLAGSALEIGMEPHELWVDIPAVTRSIADRRAPCDDKCHLSGVLSKAAKFVGDTADKIAGVAKTIGNDASEYFNLDKPNKPDAHAQNHLAVTTPAAFMFGPNTAVRLSTNQASAYTDTRFSTATCKETDMRTIVQKASLFQQVTISPTMAAGQLLFSYPVMPLSHYTQDKAVKGTQFFLHTPSWLDWLSFYHQQWSGDIVFRASIAATQFHVVRLVFVYCPGPPYTGTCPQKGLEAELSNPYVAWDMEQHKDVTFRVGYHGTTETKGCIPCSQFMESGRNAAPSTHYMGWLKCYLLTPLMTLQGDPTSVEMNIWVAGGENFTYDFPITSRSVLNRSDMRLYENQAAIDNLVEEIEEQLEDDYEELVLPADFRKLVLEQLKDREFATSCAATTKRGKEHLAGDGGEVDVKARSSALQAPNIIKGPSGVMPFDRFQDRVSDVRDLCKRPSYCEYVFQDKEMAVVFLNGPLTARPTPTGTQTFLPFSDNLMYNIADAYALWAGSVRYSFIPMTSRTDPWLAMASLFYSNDPSIPTLPLQVGPQQIQNFSQDAGMEVEVPYIHEFSHLMTHPTGPWRRNFSNGELNLQFYTSSDKTTAPPMMMAVAAGNDFTLRLPVCPPELYYGRSTA